MIFLLSGTNSNIYEMTNRIRTFKVTKADTSPPLLYQMSSVGKFYSFYINLNFSHKLNKKLYKNNCPEIS